MLNGKLMYVIKNGLIMSALCTDLLKKNKNKTEKIQCLDIYELSIENMKMCRACQFLYKIFLIKYCFAKKLNCCYVIDNLISGEIIVLLESKR